MRLKPGLRVPGLVASAVSVVLWCCCDLGDCPLASQTLLAVAPGSSHCVPLLVGEGAVSVGHVVSLPRRVTPVAGPGRHRLVGEQGPAAGAQAGWLGNVGFPGSPPLRGTGRSRSAGLPAPSSGTWGRAASWGGTSCVCPPLFWGT